MSFSFGQGSVARSNKIVSGAPFPPGAANNGLSVDPISGAIVLGNDRGGAPLAALLNDREIPMGNFEMFFNGNLPTEYVAIRNRGSGIPTMISQVQVDFNGFTNLFVGQNVNRGNQAGGFIQMYNDVLRGITFGLTSQNNNTSGYVQNTPFLFANDTFTNNAKLALMANDGILFIPSGRSESEVGMQLFTSGNLRLDVIGTNPFVDSGQMLQVNGTSFFVDTIRYDKAIAAPATAVAGAVVNRYGGANNFLGDPASWLSINVGGALFKIPIYNP